MKVLKTIPVGVVLSFAIASAAWSQTVPGFTQFVTTTVRASGASDYEDYLKKLAAARDKLGLAAPSRVTVYTYRMGGPLFTYLVVSPFGNWAEIDSWTTPGDILTKAYGEIEAGKIVRAMRGAIESQKIEVYRVAADLSRSLAAAPPPYPFAVLNRIELYQGTGQSYTLALSKIKAAVEKAGNFPPQLVAVMVHGETPTYLQATPFTKWAERDTTANLAQALEKLYGQNEARMIQESIAKATKHRESYVIAQRADLSWMRKSTTSQ